MHDKEIEPILDFCTRMQIQEIMTASYIHTPMSFDLKMHKWQSVSVESFDRGMNYRARIRGEYV